MQQRGSRGSRAVSSQTQAHAAGSPTWQAPVTQALTVSRHAPKAKPQANPAWIKPMGHYMAAWACGGPGCAQ